MNYQGNGSVEKMKNKWTESAIREEISKLDKKTGLHGARLPISFNNARCALGMYSPADGGSFKFSNYYYQDPNWPIEEALDTIRHEYAHYMDHVLYNHCAHGSTWKHCCAIVGAMPIRCYNEKRADYYRQKHLKEESLSKRYDEYYIGDIILHPKYGKGVIKYVQGESISRIITVEFTSVGEKVLGLSWVDTNCNRYHEEN